MTRNREGHHPQELTLVHVGLGLLSLYGMAALLAYYLIPLPEPTRALLDTYDDAICYLFIADFLVRLWIAPSKKAFLRWGWIDLVASLPQYNVLRVGRLVYVAWVARQMWAFPSPGALLSHLYKKKARAVFATALLATMMVAGFAAIFILEAEAGAPSANILTPQDAVWWAWVTVCTVGYGDKYPVTLSGRLVAAVLMAAGITLFGTLAGLLSSWFMRSILQDEEREVELLRLEVHRLRKHIEEIDPPPPPSE